MTRIALLLLGLVFALLAVPAWAADAPATDATAATPAETIKQPVMASG